MNAQKFTQRKDLSLLFITLLIIFSAYNSTNTGKFKQKYSARAPVFYDLLKASCSFTWQIMHVFFQSRQCSALRATSPIRVALTRMLRCPTVNVRLSQSSDY